MRTTLKRGIGRVAVVNGDGRAVLPPGALSPVTRYRQPERKRGPLRRIGTILFVLLAISLASVLGMAGGTYLWELESLNKTTPVGRFKVAAERLKVPLPNKPTVALVIGYDHRPVHPKGRANQIESGERISSDHARDTSANEVSVDQNVPLRFVYFCIVGTVCQQPLAEKPAGLALNRLRIDQPPQGITKPEKKRVP